MRERKKKRRKTSNLQAQKRGGGGEEEEIKKKGIWHRDAVYHSESEKNTELFDYTDVLKMSYCNSTVNLGALKNREKTER